MIINTGMSEEKKGGVSSFNGREGAVTPQSGDYTAEQVGAAPSSHNHSAGSITSGTLPIARGGTGATNAASARSNLGAAPTASPVFTGSISLGRKTGTTVGNLSVAEGSGCIASGDYSHAEGYNCISSGFYSHAEGETCTASGVESHAEGGVCTASGSYSHAEGYNCTASVGAAHAEGFHTKASASYQHAGGAYNVEYVSSSTKFIIGKGSSDTARANCFRVTDTGVYATGAHNTTGADYAELFEWLDGNSDGADRCGRFVTLDGEKIRLAGPGDDFILGIVSGNPSVVGDVHDDQWQGMYLYDIFGRPLWEDVEVPDVTVEEPDQEDPESTVTRVIIPAHIEHRQKLNPAYDGSQPYQPRTQRPEWDAVGMLGKLVAVDDGTCQAGGWCTVGEGGAATHSAARTRYRVMARLDECHIRVLIL